MNKPTKVSQKKKLNQSKSIENYRKKLEQTTDTSVAYNTIDLSNKFDTIVAVFVSDWHIGAQNFDIDRCIEVLEYTLNTSNAYLFILGDMLSTAILHAVQNMFDDLLYPNEQWDNFVDLFSQVAKAGKIEVLHPGNHEKRVNKETGLNIIEQAAKTLDVSNKYAPDFAVTEIVLKNKLSKDGKFTYRIVTHHGDGVDFTKLQSKCPNSDLNVVGHWHRLKVQTQANSIFDPELETSIKHETMNVILPNEGQTPFEFTHTQGVRSPYYAIEISSAKNPLYNPQSKSEVKEREFVPATRSIPILSITNTKEKDAIIKRAKKSIDQTKNDYMKEILEKTKELTDLFEKAGIEINKEAYSSLLTNTQRKLINKKVVKKQQKQNEISNDNGKE